MVLPAQELVCRNGVRRYIPARYSGGMAKRSARVTDPPDTALRRLRVARELTQAQLADRVHSSQPQIDRLEKGQRKMTKAWAMRLAAALGCQWLELFDETAALTGDEIALVDLYRGLQEPQRRALLGMVEAMAPARAKPTGTDG